MILTPASATLTNKLVVFLPGTGAPPQAYSKLLEAAAAAGHFVIGLSYLSQPTEVEQSNAWCEAAQKPASANGCNQELHERMLFGHTWYHGQSQGLWDVEQDDSVRSLVLGVLRAVEWGASFIDSGSGDVAWDKVIISGHSQGAGHAAYMSYAKDIDMVLFSGPQDCEACATPWLKQMQNSTAHRRVLFHKHEECGPSPIRPKSYCEPDLMLKNLASMGLRSVPVTWNGGLVPDVLEIVISNAKPSCSNDLRRAYHASVAINGCAPLDQNITALWTALFTGLSPKRESVDANSEMIV